MKLLILGGTQFLGRAIVDAALEAGHTLTLFNRGQSNPQLFANLELLRGDRDGKLDLLRGRKWDAVIDTCGYLPRLVRNSAELLANAVDHYTFISTISVYAEPVDPGIDESAPLATIEEGTIEDVTGETYGALKVLCEQAAHEAMNGRVLQVRAGLLVGPYDLTDRFTYWPHRLDRGGEVLAPGNPNAPVQFIDVRDIARWTISATETRLAGPFNVTGPSETVTMRDLLLTCRDVCGKEASLTWVTESFLLENDVAPFTELPLWLPQEAEGMVRVNIQKARRKGLAYRLLAETVRDTLNWSHTRLANYEWRNGLQPQRETALLEKWHNSH